VVGQLRIRGCGEAQHCSMGSCRAEEPTCMGWIWFFGKVLMADSRNAPALDPHTVRLLQRSNRTKSVGAKSAYKFGDAGCKSFLYRRDARKAFVENKFRASLDSFRTPLPSATVGHRESQSCLGDIIDAIA
jgi:hypothetical protein